MNPNESKHLVNFFTNLFFLVLSRYGDMQDEHKFNLHLIIEMHILIQFN